MSSQSFVFSSQIVSKCGVPQAARESKMASAPRVPRIATGLRLTGSTASRAKMATEHKSNVAQTTKASKQILHLPQPTSNRNLNATQTVHDRCNSVLPSYADTNASAITTTGQAEALGKTGLHERCNKQPINSSLDASFMPQRVVW